MQREEMILTKYGLNPKQENRIEIKKLLKEEIENVQKSRDHECLRVLCFLLFLIGNVEDCELIWQAKTLNMDAGCMVDSVLLCGAGYRETVSYLEKKKGLEKMRKFILEYVDEEFDRREIINQFKSYYGV